MLKSKLNILEYSVRIFVCVLALHAGIANAQNNNFKLEFEKVPLSAKFIDNDWYIWGGSVVEKDGQYHMFYSRWPKKYHFSAWLTYSEIAHAVSDSPFGPFKHKDVAMPARGAQYWDGLNTHNPTIKEFNGKYYLYYTGTKGNRDLVKDGLNWVNRNNQRIGVAVADHPDGPWQRFDQPLLEMPTDSLAHDALMMANPSVTQHPDGRYILVYKCVGKKRKPPFGGPVVHMVAFSDSPTGPFTKFPDPIFTAEGHDFPAEDPYIWTQNDKLYAIVKDFRGAFTKAGQSLALFESSNGINWKLSQNPLVSTMQIEWENNVTQKVKHLERPQVLIKNGKPIALMCAADTLDEYGVLQSWNVQIPIKQQPKQIDLTEWKLMWNDEFDYPDKKLDKNWEAQNGPSGHILCSRWRENAVVHDGILELIAKKEKRGGQDWTAASLWTHKKFKYGYFECRYKYAGAETTNNSFWLMTRGDDPKVGKRFEIDINEGHYPKIINTNIHNHTDRVIRNGKKISTRYPKHFNLENEYDTDFSEEFHTYGLEWNEKEMIFYFDGKEIRRVKNEFCYSETPIWLSLALVKWYGTLTDAVDGTSMKVDYVRYYQVK